MCCKRVKTCVIFSFWIYFLEKVQKIERQVQVFSWQCFSSTQAANILLHAAMYKERILQGRDWREGFLLQISHLRRVEKVVDSCYSGRWV